MKKTVLRLTAGIAVALAVIFLYALAREGGHALMVLLLGGQVTNFQVNFLRHPPQISYTGVSDPLHRALVSLAGPVLPLLLIPPATLVLRRTGSVPVKGALLLLLLALLSTTLTSVAVSLGCGLGGGLSPVRIWPSSSAILEPIPLPSPLVSVCFSPFPSCWPGRWGGCPQPRPVSPQLSGVRPRRDGSPWRRALPPRRCCWRCLPRPSAR